VLDIVYPNICTICSDELTLNENFLCLNCKYDLPYVQQSKSNIESLNKLFWGRTDVEQIFALLNYQKGNQTQKVLHELKYNGKTKLATHFGQLLGEVIPKTVDFNYIIPIPLHKKKQRLRGFNQSTMIANGVSKITKIPVSEKFVERNTPNKSQTNFTKYDRWDNVKSIFKVKNSKILEDTHVLLIDDVLTTGATIEACVKELLNVKNCKVSIATLAARI
jgi:ComF family protein